MGGALPVGFITAINGSCAAAGLVHISARHPITESIANAGILRENLIGYICILSSVVGGTDFAEFCVLSHSFRSNQTKIRYGSFPMLTFEGIARIIEKLYSQKS